MFTFTSAIFGFIIDIIFSAILIGATIAILSIIVFLVYGFINSLISVSRDNFTDNK